MRRIYDPFVLRRMAEGRIFFVSARMPFEFLVQCFQHEMPFFLVSQLDDGRIAITPNEVFIPRNLTPAGETPFPLFPVDFEYVTLENGVYPVIVTAHPLPSIGDWLRKFERCVNNFARVPLGDFVGLCFERMPFETKKKMETSPAIHVPLTC